MYLILRVGNFTDFPVHWLYNLSIIFPKNMIFSIHFFTYWARWTAFRTHQRARGAGLTLICSTEYGRPIKPFFIETFKNLGFGKQIGQINFRAFWEYQHPFWYSESLVHVFHYSTIIFTKNKAFISTSEIFIWNLNMGRKELGIKPSCVFIS